MNPEVSVIIPVYNSEKSLARALESAFSQIVSFPYEVVVALDPSTDGSATIVEGFAEKHDNLVLLAPEKRLGVALSRLEAMKIAKGKFLAFLDADDRLAPKGLATWHEAITKTGADCVNSSFFVVSGPHDKVSKFPFTKKALLPREKALSAYQKDIYLRGFMWTKMYRKDAIMGKPLIFLGDKKDMFEDVAVNLAFLSHCDKVALVKEPLYYYYKNVSDSATSVRRSDRARRHLNVFILERLFLETTNPSLLNTFFSNVSRLWLSLAFDLRLDKKSGASRAYIKEVKKDFGILKDKKKDPREIPGAEELSKRALI